MSTETREGPALAAYALGLSVANQMRIRGGTFDLELARYLLTEVCEERLPLYVSPAEVEEPTRDLAERTMSERIRDERAAAKLVLRAMSQPGYG